MERRALVLVNGELTELPIGDTLTGASGLSAEDEVYSKRVDFVGDDVIYKGEALVGSLVSDGVWRIRKITIGIDGDVTEVWANGLATFVHIWDNRLTYTYS